MDAVKEAVLEQKIDNLTARFDEVDARFKQVDARFEQVDARFDRLEDRFEQAEERNHQEHRAIRAEMNAGFRAIEDNLHSLNRTLIVTMGSLVIAVVAALGTITAALLS